MAQVTQGRQEGRLAIGVHLAPDPAFPHGERDRVYRAETGPHDKRAIRFSVVSCARTRKRGAWLERQETW